MTLQELLNSEVDLDSLVALARQGLAWWLDEMSAMLPTAWRERLSSGPRLLAEQVAPGVWRYWKDGRASDRGAAGPDTPVGLLLRSSAVLVREVQVPRMPAADVRRMLALDIDRLSPLNPDLVHFDVEVLDRDAKDGRQRVLVGIADRTEAASLLASARAEGLKPAAIGARVDGETPGIRFDFLAAAKAAAGDSPPSRARLYWWSAVAALLVANFAVLVGRDIIDVERLRGQVDAQAPIVNTVLALRRRVGAEEQRRTEMITRGQRGEPLRMLSELTQAVPPGAWVQHLEWNGQTLRIVGFKRPDIDMAAALRGSGAFTNVRVLGSEAPETPLALAPFDITADARAAGPPTEPHP